MDGHQGVVGKPEHPQAAQVGENARGQKDETVVRQVQCSQGLQGAPVESRAQAGHCRVVVEGSAQVELPQRLVQDGKGLGMNNSQLVVAQIQRAKPVQSFEGEGFHLRNSGFEDDTSLAITIKTERMKAHLPRIKPERKLNVVILTQSTMHTGNRT